MNNEVIVIGAGSWGTALSIVLADNGYQVTLVSRKEKQVEEINEQHTNEKYLPGVILPDSIYAASSIDGSIKNKRMVLLAVPSHVIREMAQKISPYLCEDTLIVHAAKGLEINSLKRMSEVIREEISPLFHNRLVVLSGPSHAEEVSHRSPTTIVVASEDMKSAEEAQDIFINQHFRVYTNPDVIGVEIGGALKNIIALGAGLSDGLGFGDNAKAALMTRGLAEIGRLGVELGANPLTFAGLAGVGDLIVTCTSKHSRNWRAGYMIGQGQSLDQVLSSMGMVVEGVKTTKAAHQLSLYKEVEMPITAQLYKVLFEGKNPKHAVEDLMGRGRTHEMEEIASHMFPFPK
ncbi:NAD(P)H-dependent glycerol-3-phosphate dehydrogenase [Microaerobacter geothermalis]|uniref:NAD(P)H-dependent glycerol-3-phosphate dehydrogenase n=1 Tax=Microaerobacter geothermalis TaxID=674972 RepID=UPI001F20F7BD|nr:NAD(P)H-dependent glycerol-3-phosphate dehydrogenase [Microaerobacter geothermalis]MCF6093529.1 NAD(P)H-dependent glycerol-3-phosphate dehydrogenase [Microaerobacter geothermalis]